MSALSGPRVDTASDADALFVNRFIKKDTDVTNEDDAVEFRRWKEQELEDERATGEWRMEALATKARREKDRKRLRKVKEEIWQCCIDSSDRDLNYYPHPSAFTINLGQKFQNVVRTRLLSLEFPNVLNVVNGSNNTLTWINLEDVDLGFPVYSITIPTGTYNYRALETQLNLQLHSSDLKRRDGNGTPHFFVVTLDGATDKVSFSSIIPQATVSDPLQVQKDTNRIRVTAHNHGFVTGDSVRVLGVQGILGGISAAELNGSFIITVPLISGTPSADYFEYEVANVARGASNNMNGGGKSVQIGKEAPFQFTFQENPTNASRLLGFPPENSSLPIPDSYLQTYTVQVSDVVTGEMTLIVAIGHGLTVGDRIYLRNFIVSPSIYAAVAHRGEFYVHAVVSPDVFVIDYATTYVSDVSFASISTRIVTMYMPNHGFNRIAEFSCVDGRVHVVSLFPHNLNIGQKIFVRCDLSRVRDFAGAFVVVDVLDDDAAVLVPVMAVTSPSIDGQAPVDIVSQTVDPTDGSVIIVTGSATGLAVGEQAQLVARGLTLPLKQSQVLVTKIISETSFIIEQLANPMGAFDIPLNASPDGILRDGILLNDQDFTLYNVSPVGGLTTRDLSDTRFSVRTVLSPDYFVFTTLTGFANFFDLGGGQMRISSSAHGWRGTQTNDQATGQVYRPMALTGDTYCFLRVPSLGKHSTIINTGSVTNILGKVQLTAPPVTTLFNTAVSGSLEFRDGPLPSLSTIDFQWVDKTGRELDFGQFQWSCVLEIISLNTTDEYNFQPVRVYVPDPVDQLVSHHNST